MEPFYSFIFSVFFLHFERVFSVVFLWMFCGLRHFTWLHNIRMGVSRWSLTFPFLVKGQRRIINSYKDLLLLKAWKMKTPMTLYCMCIFVFLPEWACDSKGAFQEATHKYTSLSVQPGLTGTSASLSSLFLFLLLNMPNWLNDICYYNQWSVDTPIFSF